jgi:hypothetical protein
MTDPRVAEYERRHHCRLLGKLGPGPGQDGFVLYSDRGTAVKFFDRADRFHRELEVYQVIDAKGIETVAGHAVPKLVDSDDALGVLEISIVVRPFLLDFAGAKLPHEVPEFEEHVMEEYYEHLRELFDDHWTDAMHVAEMFRRATGFTLMDIHPGNIAFDD